MTRKKFKYPLGIQTFSLIREEGYPYVDKTEYIARLLDWGKYIFLSRPRRFGKSLLLSTLHSYFEGHRELFEGLALDKMDMDWEPRPVIHIDLNAANYKEDNGLNSLLNYTLRTYEEKYGITPPPIEDYPSRFAEIIKTAYKKSSRGVVILVDEYDKPLQNLEEASELFINFQYTLKGFFSVLKSMDRYIHFAMLTGVARFNKISIFSDINNLSDISLENEFGEICGWTDEELLGSFGEPMARMAEELEVDFDSVHEKLRIYYDGYRFTPRSEKLYNPFSVMNSLRSRDFQAYWFETGTPTFFAERIKKTGLYLPAIEDQWCTLSQLLEVGFNPHNPLPMMFQTGYLTIGRYDSETKRYELRFPNYEVEYGFANDLMRVYAPEAESPNSPYNVALFEKDLVDGRPEDFMVRLQAMLKAVPYEQHTETEYRNIVFLLSLLSGTEPLAERHTHRGRTDLEVITSRYIYIFEFKFRKTAQQALEQIKDRDYSGRFALDKRQVFLIGANFSDERDVRGLTDWIIERVESK